MLSISECCNTVESSLYFERNPSPPFRASLKSYSASKIARFAGGSLLELGHDRHWNMTSCRQTADNYNHHAFVPTRWSRTFVGGSIPEENLGSTGKPSFSRSIRPRQPQHPSICLSVLMRKTAQCSSVSILGSWVFLCKSQHCSTGTPPLGYINLPLRPPQLRSFSRQPNLLPLRTHHPHL